MLDVLIVGAGAIGQVSAVSLYNSNEYLKIGLVAYPTQINQIKKGLVLEDLVNKNTIELKDFEKIKLLTKEDLSKIKLNENGFVIYATKAYSNEDVTNEIKDLLKEDTTIIQLQNGLHPEHDLTNILKNNNLDSWVVRGVTIGGVSIDDNILKSGIEGFCFGYWYLGEENDNFKEPLEKVKNLFSKTIYKISDENYKKTSILKAIVNGVNSISVIFGCTLGEVIENSFLRRIMDGKISETKIIANRLGISLYEKEAFEKVYTIYNRIKNHHPSELDDILKRFDKPDKKIGTENKYLDLTFYGYGYENRANCYYNSNLGCLVEEFVNSFNALREKDEDKAVEFGMRFIARNRILVLLEPYIFHKFKKYNLKQRQEKIKKFHEDLENIVFTRDLFGEINKNLRYLQNEYKIISR